MMPPDGEGTEKVSAPTERTEVRRLPERGVYDREEIDSIVDEALICHVGIVHDGYPVVIPTNHARVDETLYIHGSPASRLLRAMSRGGEACVTMTIVDGLVVAKSAFHNSMNYRSVVVFGAPRVVDDAEEKERALAAITNHLLPGRWDESRAMTEREMKSTLVVALDLDEASAKVRSGPPEDDEADRALGIWAGVVPLGVVAGEPVPGPDLAADVEVPPSVASYRTG